MTVPWVSAQLALNGAFFAPRLLARSGRLARMAVPLWCPPGAWSTALLRRIYWNAPNFYHPELDRAPVSTMLAGKICFEVRQLFLRRPRSSWEFIQESNRSYERSLLRLLDSSEFEHIRKGPPGIFLSWSDISLEAMRRFHAMGWKTVTMQLNCGRLEEEIVVEECRRYPQLAERFARAPDGFHERTLCEYRETDHIISNSTWGRDYLLGNGIPAEKISLVPFAHEGAGGDAIRRTYPSAFSKERPLRVLHLGQMSLRKGMARLFEAIGLLKDLPIEFTFAGPSAIPKTPSFDGSSVRVLGVVSREKVAELYRESDVFIFPTLSDAFGLTQLECMAWKLPLIASRHCGEVVRHGCNGLVLEEVTRESIAAALRHCLAHPKDLDRWSAGCEVPPACTMESFSAALAEIERRLYPDCHPAA